MLETKVKQFLKTVDAHCNDEATPNVKYWGVYENSLLPDGYFVIMGNFGKNSDVDFQSEAYFINAYEERNPSGVLTIHYTYEINNREYKFSHSNLLKRLFWSKGCDVEYYEFLVKKSLTQLILAAHKL